MRPRQPIVLPVPKILQKDVEFYILNEMNSGERTAMDVFPNAVPGIVFHHHAGAPAIESIAMRSGRKFSPPTLFLYGPGIESSVMNFSRGSYAVIQVILKPHALNALFGINASTLKDCTVELNEFFIEDLNEQLLNAQTAQEQLGMLTRFLLAKMDRIRTRDTLVEESLRLIHASAGTITVRKLLERLDISERQFERRFRQTVGVPPASYIRVKRFNEAIRLIKNGHYRTLTDVAYALKFHDQAHFIHDVKAFTGSTPKHILQKVEELDHNQAGYSYT